MRKLLVDATTIIAAFCALCLTVLAARRELGSAEGPADARADRRPVKIEGWDSVRTVGHRIGSASAPVTVLEFGDFECPACKRFAPTMKAILAAYPEDVQFVYRHWPLSYHRFARPAARAFECAATQGTVEPMYYLLYEKQDSLGLIPFTELAARAGVPDARAFAECTARSGVEPAIEADLSVATSLGLHGTPAIIVNGLYLNAVPDSARLDRFVRDALRETKR